MVVVAMVTPMSHLIMAIQIYGGGGLIGGRGLFPDSENYLKKNIKSDNLHMFREKCILLEYLRERLRDAAVGDCCNNLLPDQGS